MIEPENRAVAPVWSGPSSTVLPRLPSVSTESTPRTPAPTPTPNSPAMPDSSAVSAAMEGKSRTLQGPSAKDWERHRETIVGLYRQYPLKRPQLGAPLLSSSIMTLIRLTDFPDSKRMYDKRFREWNVFKNINSDERVRAVRRAQSSVSPTEQRHRENSFSQEDLRRTIRCARTIQQGVRRTSAASPPPTPVETQSTPVPQPGRQARRSISISDLIKQEDDPQSITAPGFPSHGKFPQTPFSPVDTPASTPGLSPGSLDEPLREQNNCAALIVPGSPDPGLDTYKAQLQELFKGPPRAISADLQTRTMGTITLKLREYYDWQLDHIPQGILPDDYLGNRSSDQSTRYWNTIKHAIYLVKISAGSVEDIDTRPDRRAWSAFSDSGTLAAGAMTTQPFDFLRNLFATLSPVNTSARPELRGILLQLLTSEAQTNLSSNHPITQICKELQNDQGCQEISQRSLQCMLDIFNSRLGRSRAITFKLLDSLATLLRRSGEYQAGLEIVTEMLKTSRPAFGPESDQARSVENELAHFYMLTDNSDAALGHCMSVVTRPPAPPASASASESLDGEPTFYQDGIAAHAMEDIAEIHQRRGDLEQCITWLERAATIAMAVWGPKAIATSHLIDKMTNLQRQFGQDLLRSATLWEAAVV
ncbi:hypothetical protein C8A00DRAFT_12697 [Chaetomidium leptoderma]|uniref:Clr5 domain-containing protein n=1 Tax=Chaetomidium leptoderma TaxID=669021 RepID=A0AAN6VR93_9PEZI|nr:hypothetical protein C8A00DRAFT_12697 [Chaetomidium leptoderma]